MYDNNSIPPGETESDYDGVYGSTSSANTGTSTGSTSSGTAQSSSSASSQSTQDYGSSTSMEDGTVQTANSDGSTTASTRADGWWGSQETYKTEGGSDGTATDTTVFYTGNGAHNSGTSFVTQGDNGPNGSTVIVDNNDGTTTDKIKDADGNETDTDHPRNETTSADSTPAHNGTPDGDPNGQSTEPSKDPSQADDSGGKNASPDNPAGDQPSDDSKGSGDSSAGGAGADGSKSGESDDKSESGDFLDESSNQTRGAGTPHSNYNGSAGSADPGASDNDTSRSGPPGPMTATTSGNADPTNSDDGTASRVKDATTLTPNFNSAAGATDHGSNSDDPLASSLHSPFGAPILPSIGHGPGGQEVSGFTHLTSSLFDGASAADESGAFSELIRAANAPLQSGLVVGFDAHASSNLAFTGSFAAHGLESVDLHVAAASPAVVAVHEVHFDQHAVFAPVFDHTASAVHH